MEVSTITLLKESVYDDEEDARLSKVTKAISQITTILPFTKQTRILLSDSEFLKYLVLNLPILKGSSITMIIDTMIYNFHYEDIFQKNFCTAIEYVAKIKDFLENEAPLLDVSIKEHYFRASMLRQDFCFEITKNKLYLKERSLKHFKNFILYFMGEDKPKVQHLQKEIIEILKTFLRFTYSEQIITKVSQLLETLRNHWKENWINGKLDVEIEELIVSKSRGFLKQDDIMILDEASPKETSFTDEDSSKYIQDNIEDHEEGKSFRKNKENEEDEDVKAFDNLIEVEEWMIAENEIPNISKNIYISDFFRIPGNFEYFLKFLFEPFHIKLNKTWAVKYPFLSNPIDPDHLQTFKTNQIFQSHSQIRKKVTSRFNIYIFRAYKIVEILSDFRNFRYMYSCYPNSIDSFFLCLYINLKSDSFLCEMNHIAHLIEVFLKRDAETTLTCLFQYNILKLLLVFLNFPKVFNLFITILNVIGTKPLIEEMHSLKLVKMLISTDFFLDISDVILMGKWKIKSFLPKNVSQEINVHFDVSQIKNVVNLDFYPLFEELAGFSNDIDRLKDHIIEKKKQNLFRNTSKKILSVQKMNFLMGGQKFNENALLKHKRSLEKTFLMKQQSIKSPLLEALNKLPFINEKNNTETPKPKNQIVPSRAFEQFLIRNKDPDLQYLDWEKFSNLYPSSTELLRESSLDKISKKPEFSMKELLVKDFESSLLIELIHFPLKSCLESHNNEKIGNLIGLPKRYSDLLIIGLFNKKPDFFNNLFKAFLLKAKLIMKDSNPSSIRIGETVNLILRECQKQWFEGFQSEISLSCRKHFMFLQKTIMNSYTWPLENQMTMMRILLIEQLNLIIRNEGNFALDESLEGLWDTLIRFFLEYKEQSIFLRYFLNIIELVLKLRHQRVIIIIFLKLNLLNTINCEILNAVKNEVLVEDLSMENFFFVCKSMIRTLEENFLSVNFPLKSQIISLNCWKILKKKFGSPQKPENNSIDSSGKTEKFQSFGFKKQSIDKKLLDSNLRSKKSLSFLNGDNDINDSEKKNTRLTKNFGNITKSSTMLFLTSPKMRNMISQRTYLQQVKESKPMTSSHIKSKTLIYN